MRRFPLGIGIGVLTAAVLLSPGSAAAQAPGHVRVVTSTARIQEWYRLPEPGVLAEVPAGTIIEVLDQEDDWFWVIAPPDARGTRKGGWIRAVAVEPYVAPVAAIPGSQAEQNEPEAPTAPTPPAAAAGDDKVSLSVSRAEPSPAPGTAPDPSKAYRFEDVHFERDRHALRQEDIATLRSAANALKGDPSLVMRIEGHTCSLGTPEHNLELGMRRAEAVRNYLVSEGIPAARLRAVSQGESQPKHDNSSEATRRLNRRVELVPGAQR